MAQETLQPKESAKGKIIALFSSASASGKTTVAINLAAQIKREGYRTCVLDLDLQFGDVCNYLKVSPPSSIYDYQQALDTSRGAALAASYLVGGPQIPDLLAAPVDIAEAYNVEPATVVSLLGELKSAYDYIFVDLVSGFTDVNLRVLEAANLIYFIGLVDFIPTIKNMKIAYDTLTGTGCEAGKIKMILNRSKAKTDIELRDVEALLGQSFYHTIPNDFAKSAEAIQKGIPVMLSAPDTELAESLRALSEKVTGHVSTQKPKSGGVKKWFGFLRD